MDDNNKPSKKGKDIGTVQVPGKKHSKKASIAVLGETSVHLVSIINAHD